VTAALSAGVDMSLLEVGEDPVEHDQLLAGELVKRMI
jgi:hypothetical protein